MTPCSRCLAFDMDMVKLCGVGLLCAFCALLLSHIKGEYAPLVRVGGTVVIFGAVFLWAVDIFNEAISMAFTDGLSDYGRIMMKALFLAFLSRVCSDICKDMGESAIGGGIELGARFAILSLCLPLIGELMGYARELMGL